MASPEEKEEQGCTDPSDDELSVPGDAAGEQPPGADRTHVNVLLDLSEEDLDSYDYHCYSGWEEAVRGWARVAPLSCILLPLKRDRKQKQKEADNTVPVTADPTATNVDCIPRSSPEHQLSELYMDPQNSIGKQPIVSEQIESCNYIAAEAMHPDEADWPVLDAMQKDISHLLLEEDTEDDGILTRIPLPAQYLSTYMTDGISSKPQNHSFKPRSKAVPIKNFTFLPPIQSQQKTNSQPSSGKKVPEGEPVENCYMFDKRSGPRGLRVGNIAHPEVSIHATASKYQICYNNHFLFPAVGVSLAKRYQVTVTPKPDTVH